MTALPGEADGGLDAHVMLRHGTLDLDITLAAGPGELVAVLGPNGSGKTTALRVLAGLLALDAGHVSVAGSVWDRAGSTRLPPQARHTGLVLADHLLFPHLSALDNVGFGPRSRGASRAAARARAREELDRVGLGDRAGARPGELSSGQAQRVALARALATDPVLLLLDEPLAALDPSTRAQTRADLGNRLRDFFGSTVLVTHDPLDALTLASRLVFLDAGRVVQTGSPAEIVARPRSPYVAEVVGLNLYAGDATEEGPVRLGPSPDHWAAGSRDVGGVEGSHVGGRPNVRGGGHVGDSGRPHVGGGHREGPGDGAEIVTSEVVPGPVWVTVAPSAVSLFPERPHGSPRNTWRLRVQDVQLSGQRARVSLRGPLELVAEVTTGAVAELGLGVGDEIWASVKATEVRAYPR
ncbi:MAG: ABC transporter ATP-binding protein [Lapillicoccus sp.]